MPDLPPNLANGHSEEGKIAHANGDGEAEN